MTGLMAAPHLRYENVLSWCYHGEILPDIAWTPNPLLSGSFQSCCSLRGHFPKKRQVRGARFFAVGVKGGARGCLGLNYGWSIAGELNPCWQGQVDTIWTGHSDCWWHQLVWRSIMGNLEWWILQFHGNEDTCHIISRTVHQLFSKSPGHLWTYGGFLSHRGTPQFSSIFCGIFHEINHPASLWSPYFRKPLPLGWRETSKYIQIYRFSHYNLSTSPLNHHDNPTYIPWNCNLPRRFCVSIFQFHSTKEPWHMWIPKWTTSVAARHAGWWPLLSWGASLLGFVGFMVYGRCIWGFPTFKMGVPQ